MSQPAPQGPPAKPDIRVLSDRVKQEGQLYSIDTLVQMQMLIEDECKADYVTILNRGRTDRRKVRQQDLKKYQSTIEDEAKEVEKLIRGSIKKVVERVGGDVDTYDRSVQHWSQRDRHFAMLGHIMIEKIRAEAKHDRDVSKVNPDLLKEIIKYQIEIFPKLDAKADNPKQRSMLKKFQLIDSTYDKFGIEEEDLQALRKIQPDEETQKLSRKLGELIHEDLEKTFGPAPQQGGAPGQPGYPPQGQPGYGPGPQSHPAYPPQGVQMSPHHMPQGMSPHHMPQHPGMHPGMSPHHGQRPPY